MKKKDFPLVSLIIPVYNTGLYLDACLDGVSRQNYPNLEVVIVDDGSTDGSGKLCDAWLLRYPEWKILHKHNGGVASARNLGLDNCNGEFVAFVDSDDVVGPDYIMNLWRLLDSSTDVDIAMAAFVRSLDGSGWNTFGDNRVYERDEAIKAMLYQTGHNDSGVWCKLFRSKLFENLRFKDGIIYEDLDLMVKVLMKCRRVIRAGTVDYLYRINPKGLTGKDSFTLCRLDVLDVTKEIFHDAMALNQSWANAARDRYFSANCNMFALLNVNGMGHSIHADNCWDNIKSLRYKSLTDSHTRMKSKLGAFVSYFGRYVFGFISSFTV